MVAIEYVAVAGPGQLRGPVLMSPKSTRNRLRLSICLVYFAEEIHSHS